MIKKNKNNKKNNYTHSFHNNSAMFLLVSGLLFWKIEDKVAKTEPIYFSYLRVEFKYIEYCFDFMSYLNIV